MAARNLSEAARATVNAIVASPQISMYNVGITMSPDRRRRQYVLYSTPRPWNHMAFLAYGLTLSQAKSLEEDLFNYCTKTGLSSVRYKKYSGVKDGPYRSSAGGRKDDEHPIYSVYLAWCDPS